MNNQVINAAFSYGTMPNPTVMELQACAERVRTLRRRGLDDIATIGRELNDAKQRLKLTLGHGHFGAWLESEVKFSERTAERYMWAARWDARWKEGKTDTVSDLEAASVYLLSAPSTPPHVTNDVRERLNRGESMPVESVRTLVREARAAAKKLKEAQLKKDGKATKERRAARLERERLEEKQLSEARQQAAIDLAALILSKFQDDELRNFIHLFAIGELELRVALQRALAARRAS